MNTKHTPGPWNDTTIKAIPSKPCTKHNYIGGPSNQWIAATLCCGATTYEERNANSRLIAAAPELLSALRTLIAQADRHGAEGVYWDEARAAIAKATGSTTEHEAAIALGFDSSEEAAAHDAWLQEHGTPEFKKWRAGIEG